MDAPSWCDFLPSFMTIIYNSLLREEFQLHLTDCWRQFSHYCYAQWITSSLWPARCVHNFINARPVNWMKGLVCPWCVHTDTWHARIRLAQSKTTAHRDDTRDLNLREVAARLQALNGRILLKEFIYSASMFTAITSNILLFSGI